MIDFPSRSKRNRVRWAGEIGLVILVLGILLAGCAPTASPTLPPATPLSKAQPAPFTQPPVPTAMIGPKLPPSAAPTVVPTAGKPVEVVNPSRKSVTVTILHTNDVRGETDPCG